MTSLVEHGIVQSHDNGDDIQAIQTSYIHVINLV